MQSHRQSEFCANLMYHESDPRPGGLRHLETFTWQNLTPAERATRSGRPGYPPWRVTHLSCQRDQIKMRDYMDRRVTPPKRVTSPTWGPPPPCKQALREVLRQQVRQSVNFISTVIIIFLSFTSFTIIWPRLFKIWIALSTG